MLFRIFAVVGNEFIYFILFSTRLQFRGLHTTDQSFHAPVSPTPCLIQNKNRMNELQNG